MSGAGAALQAAVMAALEALEGIGGIYPGRPLQAVFPYAIVEAGLESDWGHKSGRGREVRLAVTLRRAGERPERVQANTEAMQAALDAGLDVEGWQLVTLTLLRSRTLAEGQGGETGWATVTDYRARMLASET